MTVNRSQDYLFSLVNELRKSPNETEWLEFKHNKAEPEEIGEYLSARANAAALHGKASAYLLWGIDDRTHEVIRTSFNPAASKVGNEELENWQETHPKLFKKKVCKYLSKSSPLLLSI